MGSYINPGGWPPENPAHLTKEEFLVEHGILLDHIPTWEEVPQGMLPVCWISNGFFTAAGIAYCRQELDEFTNDLGGRPNKWYFCLTEVLVLASNLRSESYYWDKVPEDHR